MTTINLKDYYPWYLTNEYSAGPDQCPALRAAAPLCGGAPPPRMLSYDGARK